MYPGTPGMLRECVDMYVDVQMVVLSVQHLPPLDVYVSPIAPVPSCVTSVV